VKHGDYERTNALDLILWQLSHFIDNHLLNCRANLLPSRKVVLGQSPGRLYDAIGLGGRFGARPELKQGIERSFDCPFMRETQAIDYVER